MKVKRGDDNRGVELRILLKFTSLKNCSYLCCYEKLRGFVYGLQRESAAFNKHDIEGYKLFTFSNIFPATDSAGNILNLKEGDTQYFQISSPDTDFIYYIRGRLSELQEQNSIINIGEYQFSITSVKSLNPRIDQRCKLVTGTPIIMRIPHYRYEEYGIDSHRRFEYWRPEYGFDIFVKQLTDNLLKKYKQFSGNEITVNHIFEGFQYKKSVSTLLVEKGKTIPVIGSLWEFEFSHLTKEQREVLQLGLDAGFGEMNASGYGFMNKVIG